MGKMQHVNFKTVEEFLEYLPENERKIVDYLRSIVLDCMPDCKEKLSYNVPYYSRHTRICYIWPSSVNWGNVPLSGVSLGFCNGKLLRDELGFLENGNRKQVYVKTFMDVTEIDIDLVRTYLYEAIEADEQLKKDKLKRA